jgi:homoserine kinase
LHFVVLTPEYPLATSESRQALPEQISREDAVFNLQRLALLLRCIESGDTSLFREALHDRLHQPFRQKLVPGLQRALALEHPDVLGVCLSGAGPSVVAFAERNFEAVEDVMAETFREYGLAFTTRKLCAHQEF